MNSDSKKIEQYLHLYLGCECQTPDGIRTLISVTNYGQCTVTVDGDRYFSIFDVKPIFRKLSDMSEEERLQVDKDSPSTIGYNYSPKTLIYLLSNHFDLFNLIPELAIDKKTLKQ